MVDGVVLPQDLLNRTILILENYIDEDELAEGYGGGTENLNFRPAKKLLAKLKKIEDAALREITELKGRRDENHNR